MDWSSTTSVVNVRQEREGEGRGGGWISLSTSVVRQIASDASDASDVFRTNAVFSNGPTHPDELTSRRTGATQISDCRDLGVPNDAMDRHRDLVLVGGRKRGRKEGGIREAGWKGCEGGEM